MIKSNQYQLAAPHFSHVANRTLPIGTPVSILATRDDGNVLVKAKGASWPISLPFSKLTVVSK